MHRSVAVNHDALFKMLLKRPAILKGFFDAFLPQVAEFIDFGSLVFVDKERVTADGKKRTGDLLVKTCFRGESAGFLIHFEHQQNPIPILPEECWSIGSIGVNIICRYTQLPS